MIIKLKLLCSAAPLCLIAAAASAQDAPAPAQPATNADGATLAADGTQEAAASDDIVVLGFGQSRQVQTVTAADLDRLTPGTSPLKAIAKLPGVNFQSADAFGAYEWAVRISLRGFNQNQLGFTLDGIPLGDMSYGNVNGLHISRAAISENIASTTVAQGAGAIGTASTSNLGGTLQFTSLAPSDTAGIAASATYGSDETYRAYVRAESGDLGGGIKGYLSYGYLKTDKWKGFGEQRQHQASARVEADLGTTGSINAFVNFSDRKENDYQDLSYSILSRIGYFGDNISNNYALAVQLADIANNIDFGSNTTGLPGADGLSDITGNPATNPAAGNAYPAPYGTIDDVYYDAGGLRRDWLTGATFDGHLAPGLTLTSTIYYHTNKGQGSWISPYYITPNGAPDQDGSPITDGAPLAFRTTEYSINRGGNITNVAIETGPNRLEAGLWYETNTFRQARRYYGMSRSGPNRDALDYQDNPYFTQWEGKYGTDTVQYHVADTLDVGQLTVNAGWKGMRVLNTARLLTGTLVSGSIEAKDWFLPQVGAVFHLGAAELFASYTENMRAFVSAATAGPFQTTQAGFDNGIRGKLKPERTKTVEGGARFRSGGLQLSLAGYYVDFSDRLLAFANGSGIQGNPATLNNAGDVESYGAEISANYRIFRPLSIFANYSYNHSTYQDNVVNNAGAVLVPTQGKFVVDSPEHMAKGEIVYDDNTFIARAGIDYMSKRYFSYVNDASVPGRALVDASLGYRFHGGGFLGDITIEGSVTNATDKKYFATVGTNGFGASGDNQTLMVGAPRQWFITLKKGL